MADAFGIDYGGVESKATNILAAQEALKEARIRNTFLPKSLELSQQGQETGNAAAALNLSTARQGVADAAAERAARGQAVADAGITGPEATLLTINPQQAATFTSAIKGMDDQKRAALADQITQLGQFANYVKTAADPAAAYVKAKGLFSADAQKQMPATYDPVFIDHTLAQAAEMQTLIDHVTGTGTDLTKDAPSGYRWSDSSKSKLQIIPGGPKDSTAPGNGGLDTTAANGIRSTAALAYGGTYDPTTGEFALLDKTQAGKLVETIARAQEIVAKDSSIVPGRAVQMALKELGGPDAGASGGDTGGNAAADTSAAASDVATPQTQADYDALPSGATFKDPGDGQIYKKP